MSSEKAKEIADLASVTTFLKPDESKVEFVRNVVANFLIFSCLELEFRYRGWLISL